MLQANVSLERDDVRNDRAKLARVRNGFFARGESIADWSRSRGYDPKMVGRVLNGELRCARGVCHQIAVDLGLKDSHDGQFGDPRNRSLRLSAEAA